MMKWVGLLICAYIVVWLPSQQVVFSQNGTYVNKSGINLTGLERSWKPIRFSKKQYARDIQHVSTYSFSMVRLPISYAYATPVFNTRSILGISPQHKLRWLIKKGAPEQVFVLALFDGGLTNDNYKERSLELADFWKRWAVHFQDIPPDRLYFEIYNEPTVDPWRWREAALTIIDAIREVDSTRALIVGATNYNSMYELVRMEPLPRPKLMYTFHFYEPFVFTHQGADWIGAQVATTGIPFPADSLSLPPLAQAARGTEGEANYRDYMNTGTQRALHDKLTQVANWAQQHQVDLWCTEFGSIRIADPASRCQYHQSVMAELKALGIPGFVWEYSGNFGILENGSVPRCFLPSP